MGGEYPGPGRKVEAAAPPLGRRMPMPKLSPEWQQPGDLGIARPDNHTTSRRCSGVSLGSTRRRPATCFVTIGPWGVSRDQRRGGAGAARCHDLREGPLPLVRFWDNSVLLGFRSKPSTQLVCDAHQASDLVRVTTKWTTCVLHRYRLTTSHRLVPSQQQVDSL